MTSTDLDNDVIENRRQHARMPVHWQGKLIAEGLVEDCFVLDISPGGARVQSSDPLEGRDSLVLRLDQGDTHEGEIVWRQGSFLGLRFSAVAMPAQAMAAATA